MIPLKAVVIATFLDVLFFSFVDPSSGNSLLIILGGGFMALGVYVWSALIVRVVSLYWPLTLNTQRSLAILGSALVVFLILLQSIGQLSWRDILAALPFAIILYIYMSFRVNGHQQAG